MNKKVIRLTESQFNKLIEQSVIAALNEGKFSDIAGKVGKGLGKAALAGAIGAGGLYSAEAGLQSLDDYQDDLNRQGIELQGPSEQQIDRYIQDHNMQDTEDNREQARQYFIDMYTNESKSHKLSRIIREELSKVL